MRLRLAKVDEVQLRVCIKHSVWGSNRGIFKSWLPGDLLAFIVNGRIAAVAEVSGEPFVSDLMIWNNNLFDHRIPITFMYIFHVENGVPIEEFRELLKVYGQSYGWVVQNKVVLKDNIATAIMNCVNSMPNQIREIEQSLTS